jgi:DNA-binding winged helix-turn-helix (wHTH) protein/tetratricopeptide (TPR) repeat protein
LRHRRVYLFDGFRADLKSGLLSRGGQSVPLTPKAFDTLAELLAQHGEVLSKDELLERVWPGAFVEEATLTQNVYTLRKALGRAGAGRQYIATVPRRGYRFVAPVEVEEGGPERQAAQAPVGSLAVLPFEPLGGDPEDAYLGLGLADALITRLSNLHPLTVRPTSAVRRYLGAGRDPVAAGRDLRVDAVLDASLKRSGDRLRITVQLVGVREAAPLWAAQFDAQTAEIFELEDSISRRLADELRLHLSREQRARLGRPTTRSPEAYRAYARGRYLWNRRTEESLQAAVACFREAIALDPDYALAHCGLADCSVLLPLYGSVAPQEAFPQAMAAAERALDLDPLLAEAHTSLAYARFFYGWDWAAAERGFARALELNPGYATAHHWRSFLLAALGRHAEAVAEAERALELDPLSLVISTDLGLILHFGRETRTAIEQFRRTLELDPQFAYAHFGLGHAWLQAGRLADAVAEHRRAAELSPGSATMRAALGLALARAGHSGQARRLAAELAELARERYVEASHFAFVAIGLGEKAQAIEWLGKACDERSRFVVFLDRWSVYDPLRGEPGWEELRRRVGLPATP